MNAGLCLLRRGLVAAALVVAVMGAGAGAAAPAPNVVLDGSSSRVSYSLLVPPGEPEADTMSDSGRETGPFMSAGMEGDTGSASASTRQSTIVRHGPTANGYTTRLIRSVAVLSGSAKLDDPAGEDVTASALARSVTDFTVNNAVPYAFNNTRNVGTDSYDPDKECSRATVTLRRGATVVYRRVNQTPTPGCPAAPAEVGTDGGTLTPGTYRLTTQLTTEAAARKEYPTDFVGTMAGRAATSLTLGTGQICRNVLPGPGGATIEGTSGRDVLCGGNGPDTLKGFGGGDTILGQGGGDTAIGGPGADTINAGAGPDTVFGNSGADSITPAGGADTVYAGDHNDTVRACDNVKDMLYGQGGTADRVFRDPVDAIGGWETVTAC